MLATIPVAAVLGAALLAPASASACPAGGYCTNSSGVYELVVPPFPTYEPYLYFRDCVWNVHVDFGDGESENYVFEADKGLAGSHKYTEYRKYTAKFTASGGYHKNPPGGECIGKSESFDVYYQSPQEILEEEQRIKAEKEAKEKREAEEKAAKEAKKRQEIEEREAREKAAQEKFSGSGGSGSEGSSGSGGQNEPAAFWQSCRGGRVLVHAVGCPKARKVLGRARRTDLIGDSPQQVLGFSCRLTMSRPHQISCRRGKSRILGPL